MYKNNTDILIIGLRLLFILFMIYTIVFIVQWCIGIYVSIYKFSEYKTNSKRIKRILPNKMAKDIPVSVIIPAYNEEACIVQTVKSLIEEEYPYMDIIIVNDGSSDNTEKYMVDHYHLKRSSVQIRENIKTNKINQIYENRYRGKQIFLITKENGGKADALNCGLNVCENKYCVILDADTKVCSGSIRNMCSYFMVDKKMIVCAGAVTNGMYGTKLYKSLNLFQKALVVFQQLEYYRTFYMQRILFNEINANVVVSGAFAMFDCDLVKAVGGYRTNTIGEDMELTMRLHAFCRSQKRKYHIGYVPEVKCITQVPFSYRDYYHQRRRWHIGMIQSLKEHKYMLGSIYYGGAGIISGSFILFYELWAPFIEIMGVITLGISIYMNLVNIQNILYVMLVYIIFAFVTQLIMINVISAYEIEKITFKNKVMIMFMELIEIIFFHPFNIIIKLGASFTVRKHRKTWKHINRMNET